MRPGCLDCLGGQRVAGSNPVIPTVKEQVRGPHCFGGAGLLVSWVPKYALDEHGRDRTSVEALWLPARAAPRARSRHGPGLGEPVGHGVRSLLDWASAEEAERCS